MTKGLSMTDKILKQLRDEIIKCVYNVDDLITEAEISKKYSVSKTPAREALNYLCMEGLLDKIPHKGYLVKGISLNDLQNLFQFRKIIESAAVDLAVQYASPEEIERVEELTKCRLSEDEPDAHQKYNELNYNFHVAVAQLSRNPYLASSLGNVLNRLQRILTMDFKLSNANELLAVHTDLIDAIKTRDMERARAITKEQFEEIERRIYFREAFKFEK